MSTSPMSPKSAFAALCALLAMPGLASAKTIDVPKRASATLQGERAGDLAGASVAPAGDVNGDGRADVIVGAPRADPLGRLDSGSAYVVFGGGPGGKVSLGALGTRGFRIDGAPLGVRDASGRGFADGAGSSVAGAGDVNGDGLDDLLVMGAYNASLVPANPYVRHAVYIVFGKRDSAPVDLAALGSGGYVVRTSPQVDESDVSHGWPVGDVNGDGRADLAVDRYVPFSEDSGNVSVVYGKADAAPVELPNASVGRILYLRHAASDVAAAGDVNGDGIGDMLIGVPGASSRGRWDGAVFVLYGRRAAGGVVRIEHGKKFGGFEVFRPLGAHGFGYSVARLGNGFVAGAPLKRNGRVGGTGGAWIVARRGAKPIRLAVPRGTRPAGIAVDAPGDINGDGRRDVLVMTKGRLRGGSARALLFSATGRRTAMYGGLRNEIHFHASAVGAGNVGGNARRDLIFGSPGDNAAYIVTG